ncbi:DUF3800 domain-containing protein [Candidatus Shapirobacteria bacterium]|nr:DUF3800 domain-containing protein [Candidatus Shapirobacteria bacterium]
MQKLYCFVDETGQDTKGELFLVAIVLQEKSQIDLLEEQLEKLERITKKRKLKWTKTPDGAKQEYLLGLLGLTRLREAIYYSVYKESRDYTPLVSLTIAKAITARQSRDYTVKIVIDGLSRREMEKVRKDLKKLAIRYKKIRGMKDEQSVFIRLADAMAGFLRDYTERQKYAGLLAEKLKEAKIIAEV